MCATGAAKTTCEGRSSSGKFGGKGAGRGDGPTIVGRNTCLYAEEVGFGEGTNIVVTLMSTVTIRRLIRIDSRVPMPRICAPV